MKLKNVLRASLMMTLALMCQLPLVFTTGAHAIRKPSPEPPQPELTVVSAIYDEPEVIMRIKSVGDAASPVDTLTFTCPESVVIGIVNEPKGWTNELFLGMQGATFKNATVETAKKGREKVIRCAYAANSSTYGMDRTVPGMYTCEAYGRTVTCKVIIGK